MTGQTYGRLQVLEEVGRKVLCECICGTLSWYLRGNVLAGYTKSCGCFRNDRILAAVGTHHCTGTELYKRWKTIKRRCYNPNSASYPWYGGKGIKMCARWLDFTLFHADMAEGFKPELTIDRIDSNKDYGPENCRWITAAENSRRRNGS